MRAISFLVFLFLGTSSALSQTDPLAWLTQQQKMTIIQVYAGYSGGFICNKRVDVDVASEYLKTKLVDFKVASDQLAQVSFLALNLHAAEMGGLMRQKPPNKAIAEHCKQVERAYGAAGTVIPGLLKDAGPPPKQ